MRVWSRRKVLLGGFLITVGFIIVIVGELRISSLVETNGLIKYATPHITSAGPRLMHYQYAANGRTYAGRAWLPDTAIETKTGQFDCAIRVFYKRTHPATSYAVDPPSKLPWFVGGAFLVLYGAIDVMGVWPSKHLTRRWS